jgi:predicted ATPase
MKLLAAHFRHYKSLDDVRIDLADRITVLVGPNAVGKSNIVDGLRFVRDAIASGLEHAVSSRGGIGRVRQYSRTKPFKMGMQLNFTQEFPNPPAKEGQYDFSIETLTSNNYAVDSENARVFIQDRIREPPIQVKLNRDRLGQAEISGRQAAREGLTYKMSPDELALSYPGAAYPIGWDIQRFIGNWQFSSIYPNKLRELATPDKDSNLAEDGGNWASVIKAFRRSARGKEALERINDAMRIVIPTFEEVTVTRVGSYLVPSFKFQLPGGGQVAFDPLQLSDGTLRIFGILLALYQLPAPKLLVIEEPELSVQPGVMAVLAEAFSEASEETQIIITTHSPSLVDHFKPEQVRVVTLEDGLTKVSRVKSTQIEAVKRNLMSMQDFMLAEGLQPELP